MLGDADRDRARRARSPPPVTNSRLAPHEAAELARRGAERAGDRERAPALLEAEPEREAGRRGGEHEREAELDPGQAGELDGGEVGADDLALV